MDVNSPLVTISIRSSYNIEFILKDGAEKKDIVIAEIVGSQLQSVRHSILNPDSKSQGSEIVSNTIWDNLHTILVED
jgi:hypothetical protein